MHAQWKLLTRLALPFLLAVWLAQSARANPDVDRVVMALQPPPGVVFEVVTGDDRGLLVLFPEIETQIRRLQQRFPQLDIAIVSHGSEQFGLLANKMSAFAGLHERVVSLKEESVPVHVCGTHASWRGNTQEDFPAYIDVVASAPAQINAYRELGYLVIEIP